MYKNIVNEIENRGLTCADVAKMMNISALSLKNKIEGKTDFRYNEFENLRLVLGENLSFDYLLEEVNV